MEECMHFTHAPKCACAKLNWVVIDNFQTT